MTGLFYIRMHLIMWKYRRKRMSLGLQYKNQEHIFDEKTVDGVCRF